jgi:hypothetical protein
VETWIVWLFSFVLGYSRLIWARFVLHQDMQTVLRCHMAAFAAIGGVPHQILDDRMKTVGGNLYSVPDATRKRIVEVHTLADEVRIFEDGTRIAAHPVLEAVTSVGSPPGIAGWRGSPIAVAKNQSGSFAPVMWSPLGRSRSTKPSASTWLARETSHDGDPGDRPLGS